MKPPTVDVVLLGAEWRPRALLRAQLIEEGLEVVAVDSWADARRHMRTGRKPRLALVDLHRLPDPEAVLNDLRVLMKPDRVVVLKAIGTLPADRTRRLGFHVVTRPVDVGRIVTLVKRLLQS